jgi:hypothetical protein
VGDVTAVAPTPELDLAVALAERADATSDWYGLGRRSAGQLILFVVRGQDGFDSISQGRLPAWGAGLALPRARMIAVRVDAGDPFQILRHELAHLVLHDAVRGRVPLWFAEGYATVAAGEFGRLDALQLNLGVALGRVPALGQLTAELRGGSGTAQTAYSLAATAVIYLARRNPEQTLIPLLDRLREGMTFDSAVERTTGLTIDRFDEAWQRDIKRRHGLGLWLMAGGMWALIGVVVLYAGYMRRRRDEPRRAALDVGWTIVEDAAPPPATDPADPGNKA